MTEVSLTAGELDQITSLMVHMADSVTADGNFTTIRVSKTFMEIRDVDGELLGRIAQHHPEDPLVFVAGSGIEWHDEPEPAPAPSELAASTPRAFAPRVYDQELD